MKGCMPEDFTYPPSSGDVQGPFGECRPLDPSADLGKGHIPWGRAVVGERRKAAVVGGSQLSQTNEGRCLEHSLPDFFGGLDLRVKGIDYANENDLSGF